MPNTVAARLTKLRADRRLVRLVVLAGIAISIGANVLGAESLTNAGIAAWPPLSLLLTLEVLVRIPAGRIGSTLMRVAATLAVAGAAGWLSYIHMAATARAHGEHGVNAYVWPASVDGLMIVAAVALVELGARIRLQEAELAAAAQTVTHAVVAPVVAPSPAPIAVPAPAAPMPAPAVPVIAPSPAAAPAPVAVSAPAAQLPVSVSPAPTGSPRPTGVRPAPARERVAPIAARNPSATAADLAAMAGVSERTVRRVLPGLRTAQATA